VALDDPRVSRLHAVVRQAVGGDSLELQDQGSRNGCRVNGVPARRATLRRGDLLRLGGSLLRVATLRLDAMGWEAPPQSLLTGRSAALKQTLRDVERVAPAGFPVLIYGETGTGKELIARELHRLSGRSGRLVAINCAALPHSLVESELFGHQRGAFSGAEQARPGLLRRAHGGTLLLDEVGELPAALQPKLLRAIEEKVVRPVGGGRAVDVDVRFVSATNRDLASQAGSGEFRGDLFARLAGWTLRLAPLRERLEDVLPILEACLGLLDGSARYRMTADFYEALAVHRWPFNVRELVALARRVQVLLPNGGTLDGQLAAEQLAAQQPTPNPIPSTSHPTSGGGVATRPPAPTAEELVAMLQQCQGNVSMIASKLGYGRTQVYRWMQRFGLRPTDYRGGVE